MTNFLPYAIIAGIAIVFFVICYILYSSGEKSESSPQTETQNGKTKTRTRYDGGPQPRKVQHRRPATVKHARQLPNVAVEEDTEPLPQVPKMTLGERREHPEETAFVTTKGEAVRHNGKIVYREASVPVRRGPNADSVDATQVLSRDEILEAMEKVDKEEAAAYKAREEEAKLARQRQEEQERAAQEQQLTQRRERRERARHAVAAAKAETESRGSRSQWSEDVSDTKEEKAPLADKVVADDRRVSEETQVLRKPDLNIPAKEGAVVSEGMKAVASQLEKTQRMEPIHIDAATTAKKNTPDETMVMPPVRAHKSQEKAKPVVKPAQTSWESGTSGLDLRTPPASSDLHRPSLWEQDSTVESPVVRQCVSHFLRQYGVVSPQLQQQTEYITSAAFDQIGCKTDAERQQAMAPLIAQEALQNVQKAYAAHPDDYVATIALQAFYDIINGSPISTRHLVAIDALKVMPYLSQSHYQILAILLLFLYSRNSHNVDKDSFCQYIDKYIYPFLEGFPTERPYYQQLDYLHCTAFEVKETHFAEILSDSYPLLFRYRGFTEEELRKALKGMRLSDEFIVPSFNSPLVKLAMVDESMAKRFFRMTGLTDRNIQDHILRLAKKRPANFSGEEALDIMEDISPVLADLGDIWDSSLLRVSTLSLLGLYLAQGFVKEIIGEEFDLSRWFE